MTIQPRDTGKAEQHGNALEEPTTSTIAPLHSYNGKGWGTRRRAGFPGDGNSLPSRSRSREVWAPPGRPYNGVPLMMWVSGAGREEPGVDTCALWLPPARLKGRGPSPGLCKLQSLLAPDPSCLGS